MGRARCSLYLPISPCISLYLPIISQVEREAATAELEAALTAARLALTRTLTLTLILTLALTLVLTRYEPESNELLAALLARPGAAAAERASGWQSDAPAAAEVAPCSDSWRPPRPVRGGARARVRARVRARARVGVRS